MKLFYFGSVCNQEEFYKTVDRSKVKPSTSAQSFELSLINGLHKNGVELTLVSAESIATYPGGYKIILKRRNDQLYDDCYVKVVPSINLPIIKQKLHALFACKELKNWLVLNKKSTDKAVLVYGVYPQVIKKLIHLSRMSGCKIFCVITDLPKTMYTYSKSNKRLSLLKRLNRNIAVKYSKKFDGYVYLTEAMKNEIAPQKDYVVVETIVDPELFNNFGGERKKACLYAGALYEKYGVKTIIDAFDYMKEECELWICGSGELEDYISKKAKCNRKIRYFGRLPRHDVLKLESEAMLLLNIRPCNEEYTKYSFPSKMVEYMLSGTPVLTTRLSGIPSEYYEYVYTVRDDISGKDLSDYISLLLTNNEQLIEMGKKAKKYVQNNKDSITQSQRIIEFICKRLQIDWREK